MNVSLAQWMITSLCTLVGTSNPTLFRIITAAGSSCHPKLVGVSDGGSQYLRAIILLLTPTSEKCPSFANHRLFLMAGHWEVALFHIGRNVCYIAGSHKNVPLNHYKISLKKSSLNHRSFRVSMKTRSPSPVPTTDASRKNCHIKASEEQVMLYSLIQPQVLAWIARVP